MNDRELRKHRRECRKRKQKQRERIKAMKKGLLTPPSSPDDQPHEYVHEIRPRPRRAKRSHVKCYEKNRLLVNLFSKEKRRAEMFRKRHERLAKSQKTHKQDSPRRRTDKLIDTKSSKSIRRTLNFHHTLLSQINQSYAKSSHKMKRTLANVLLGSVVRKYKFRSTLAQSCGIRLRASIKPKVENWDVKAVRNFYLRDDVSRVTTGVKRTVTFRKVKKQRRVLNDTLKNLYIKFKSETQTKKICYATFCNLRPFWVVFPQASDRNTCLCKICENVGFMASKLNSIGAIDTENLDSLVGQITCDLANKDCMYRQCGQCEQKRIDFSVEDNTECVQWYQWCTKKEVRDVKGQEKHVQFTVKEEVEGEVFNLCTDFESSLERYARHLFNIRCQFRHYQNIRNELGNDEAALHIDFSENYPCKLSSEIQSMHFGASKKQVTLHTGIMYIGGEQKSKSFCTVSDNLVHSPGAVWAHVDPILNDIRQKHPGITKVHIFSDGPTSQYRQKGNFYMFCTKLAKMGFTHAWWNIFEAGHGKGIPDAIGGALKRRADLAVKMGTDITCAIDFVKAMQGSEVFVQVIPSEVITTSHAELERTNLKPIPGTLKLHQLMTNSDMEPGTIKYRDVSCTCGNLNSVCVGHEFQKASVLAGKSVMADEIQSNIHSTATATIEAIDFDDYLSRLESCESYSALKTACNEMELEIPPLDVHHEAIFVTDITQIDPSAQRLYPDDAPRSMYPCKSTANGNCLPSSASVFAFNSLQRTSEMRVRIIIESVKNEKQYLQHEYLTQGLNPGHRSKNLPGNYAQYSPVYIPGSRLSKNGIADVYQREILLTKRDREYMGIWQLHALSNVLNVPVRSIYPKKGNPNVRKDLNRMIMPLTMVENVSAVHIMWTSTRSDMVNEHWIPNHFVPVLPVAYQQQGTLDQAPESTENFLGQYVLVKYRDTYYPGIVLDVDTDAVYVECMHRVGKRSDNCFFWPPKLKDRCWYSLENAIIIPKLTEHDDKKHYKVDEKIWHNLDH